MKKTLFFVMVACLAMVACSSDEQPEKGDDGGNDTPSGEVDEVERVFTASFEKLTRVALEDESLELKWGQGDALSVFDNVTGNAKYSYAATDGKFHVEGKAASGEEIGAVYAVYPYCADAATDGDGEISMQFPAVQSYSCEDGVFGMGANVMVAKADVRSSELEMKSTGGYIRLSLWGKKHVRSIVLEGGNNEAIAGDATVTFEGGVPKVAFSPEGSRTITLECGDLVLSEDKENPTTLWIGVPAMVFECGLTMKVNSTEEYVMTKILSEQSYEIKCGKVLDVVLEREFSIGNPFEGPGNGGIHDWD